MPNTLVLLAIISVTILITGTAGYILPTSFANVTKEFSSDVELILQSATPPPNTCQVQCKATLDKKLEECEEKETKCKAKQDKKNAKCEKKCKKKGNPDCLAKCDAKNTEKMTKCEDKVPKCKVKAMAKMEKCEGKCEPLPGELARVQCACGDRHFSQLCPLPEGLTCNDKEELDTACQELCDSNSAFAQLNLCQATDVCGA